MPSAVAYPKDESDVQEICRLSEEKEIPITARGAGTGLLGQSLSEGIVLDFTKHMNRILELESNYVKIQPGIVKGVLDKELKKKNKFLPPDPASSNFCTLGGMIANNSSGIHCLGYGNTIDFLEEISLIYSGGEGGFASATNYDDRMQKLLQIVSPYRKIIENSYPNVSKNSCGYRLDRLFAIDDDNVNKFSPQKILAASEGTLGILTSAKLRILDIPEYRSMMVLGFEDTLAALSTVPVILSFFPVAVELLDHTIANYKEASRSNDSGCLLMIEFAGRNKTNDSLLHCRQAVAGKGTVIEYATDDESISKIWRARKAALNNIMKMTVGSRKPIGLIEDTVVNPIFLAEYVAKLLQIYNINKMNYVIYGHAGDGNIHTRPLIDLDSNTEIIAMLKVAEQVFTEVISKGGTITGEHGDGLARARFIEKVYGKEITNLFSTVKKLFDPNFLMNPGKKVLA
jgi:FAD/FMN-containing dehydrogenase